MRLPMQGESANPLIEEPAPLAASAAEGQIGRLRARAGATMFVSVGVAAGGALGVHALSGSALAALGWVGVGAAAAAALTSFVLRRDLEAVSSLRAAACELRDGGSLQPLATAAGGGFAGVAEIFNLVVEALGKTARSVLDKATRLQLIPDRLGEALDRVQASAEDQEAAVEEVASLLTNINRSISGINERVDRLSRAAEESSSSILEMGSSIDEVARSAGSLHESVETSTSAVHQMGASIRQVSESSEQVKAMAENTASSVIQMDRSLSEVSQHVREAATLTENVREGAAQGAQAVSETIGDIQQIDGRTREARDVLALLAGRIGEISSILEVIDEINDETNLLSLNAAIIAAQAGEQGKAFLVVANHVKTLAQRTTASTKDIEELISSVQQQSDNAVEAMEAGIEAIEMGVSRSRKAGDALSAIRESAGEASTRVAEIARASDEQVRNSKHVAEAARETSGQIHQITAAIGEQLNASEQMLTSSEEALQLCEHVHRSTEEQRATGRYITEAIASITEMIREIQLNTADHAVASEGVSGSVTELLENAQKGGGQIPELKGMLDELREASEAILTELARFEGEVPGF